MAIIDSVVVGSGRHRVGELLLQVRYGQTIARKRYYHINDARTDAQVAQRSKLVNMLQLYRLFGDFAKPYFQGGNPKSSYYNKWMSRHISSSPISDYPYTAYETITSVYETVVFKGYDVTNNFIVVDGNITNVVRLEYYGGGQGVSSYLVADGNLEDFEPAGWTWHIIVMNEKNECAHLTGVLPNDATSGYMDVGVIDLDYIGGFAPMAFVVSPDGSQWTYGQFAF